MAEPEPQEIAPGVLLRPFEEADAEELTAVIAANREHLAARLSWAGSQGFEDTVEYLASKRAQEDGNDGFGRAIVLEGRIVGAIDFHAIDWVNRSTTIGYWLAAEATGRGLMTAAVRALVDHAFGVWGLHRVVIEVIVDNAPSRAIPHRLGFREEAVTRQSKLLGGRFEDAFLYAMLAPDWSPPPPSPAREATGSE